ncbi:hypothetical protein RHGRI_038234 [Rhododendron griersonianum]|uniref:Uncharacterized protein n=1 Tax=Rhododendron griersonianum TaxID=479676 RepID=A0AAV6HY72_9ERIC|nr:hypothetical protein RHGRI_038234 [Rhododendron griersonianum]
MADAFLQLFNRAINHLKQFNQDNRYDGNIRNNVQITSSQNNMDILHRMPHRVNKRFRTTHVDIVPPRPAIILL